MSGCTRAVPVRLTVKRRRKPEQIVAAGTSPQRLVLRARTVLGAAARAAAAAIARDLGCSVVTVRTWRHRFACRGIPDPAAPAHPPDLRQRFVPHLRRHPRLARRAPQVRGDLHAQARLLVQHNRTIVGYPGQAAAAPRRLRLPRRPASQDHRVHHPVQQECRPYKWSYDADHARYLQRHRQPSPLCGSRPTATLRNLETRQELTMCCPRPDAGRSVPVTVVPATGATGRDARRQRNGRWSTAVSTADALDRAAASSPLRASSARSSAVVLDRSA
jgi:Homeodomain-like domain